MKNFILSFFNSNKIKNLENEASQLIEEAQIKQKQLSEQHQKNLTDVQEKISNGSKLTKHRINL